MQNILLLVIVSLISGLAGVFMSSYYRKRAEKRSLKFDTLRNLSGYKFQLNFPIGNRNELMKALNEIPIIFYESKQVLKAHKELFETLEQKGISSSVSDDKFITLYKSMCNDLNMKNMKLLNDSHFLRTLS